MLSGSWSGRFSHWWAATGGPGLHPHHLLAEGQRALGQGGQVGLKKRGSPERWFRRPRNDQRNSCFSHRLAVRWGGRRRNWVVVAQGSAGGAGRPAESFVDPDPARADRRGQVAAAGAVRLCYGMR